jgi:hypothetical protein
MALGPITKHIRLCRSLPQKLVAHTMVVALNTPATLAQ